MKKKIVLIAVFVLLTAATMALGVSAGNVWDGTAATGFASGSGTEADPYVILTAEQLKYFADQVNGGNTFEGKCIKLGDDIVLNDTTGWENWDKTAPKNTWTAIGDYFMYFSGTFDGDGHTVSGIYVYTETDYQGLFGYAQNAAIKNLGTEKSYIKGKHFVGGVVGYNYAKNSTATVSNCHNTGTVNGNYDVGGVVGFNYGTVSNCYNTGTVSGTNSVGGVVGYSGFGGIVSNCYNTGTVSGTDYVGGVAGCNYGTVSDCYNTGAVSGNNHVGGVVGQNDGYGTIRNCYNTGTVNGTRGVGGVAGHNYYSTVSNCYNTGTVSGSNYNVGGVVGLTYSGMVSNCYNTGAVSGSENRVGGVVGGKWYGTVSNCYYLAGCATDGNGTVQYGIGNETKGKTTADISGQTTGLTDEQMKQTASFAGFDFNTVWTIGVVEGYDYPTLKWQKDMGTTDPDDPDETTTTTATEATTATESTATTKTPTATETTSVMSATTGATSAEGTTTFGDPKIPSVTIGCGSAIGAGTGVMCVALLLGVCVTTKKRK